VEPAVSLGIRATEWSFMAPALSLLTSLIRVRSMVQIHLVSPRDPTLRAYSNHAVAEATLFAMEQGLVGRVGPQDEVFT
jgi:hypothetical protein